MKKKESFKIKLPRKLLRLPLFSNIFSIIIMSALLFGIFFTLAFLEGAKQNIRNNTIRNYNSHLSAFSTTYNQNRPKQLTSWWQEPNGPIEASTNEAYIRAVTTRSILPSLYSNETQLYPLKLNLIKNYDDSVFNPFMSPTSNTVIPIDRIYIGRRLANQLNLSNGSSFPLYIPELNLYYTNFIVDYIFDAPDDFLDQYSVYANTLSITNIGNAFEQYYFRFGASPFISLIEPIIEPYISGQKRYRADDLLEYQYSVINNIQNEIYKWAYFFYAICGLFIFLLHFLSYHNQKNNINKYTYQTGFIPTLSILWSILRTVLLKLIIISIIAFIGLTILILLPLEFDSIIFRSMEALYPQYIFPIMPFFQESIPWTVFIVIPIGIFIGLTIAGLSFFAFRVVNNFTNTENKLSYIIIGMFFISIVGAFSSYDYISASFFRSARNRFWARDFFGTFMLSNNRYHQFKSLGFTPPSIDIPLDTFTILDEQGVSYMSILETKGIASIITNTPTTNIEPLYNTMDVHIKSLQGNLSSFSNILIPLSNERVIIGKNVADNFLTNNVLTLSLMTSTQEKIEFPVVVNDVIDIPTGDFNNSVFINQTNLARQLKIPITSLTKLQILGNKRYITPFTNSTVSLSRIQDNTKYWNQATNLLIWTKLISSLIQGALCIIFVFSIILYLSVDKSTIMVYYVWGYNYTPLNRYGALSFASFIIGFIISWLILLVRSIWNQELPSYMAIPLLTPNIITVIPSWTAVPILIVVHLLGFLICFGIFKYILKRIQKRLVHNHYKNQLS